MKKTFDCRRPGCNNTVERYESTVSSPHGVYCSKECKYQDQTNTMLGMNNPNFKGVMDAVEKSMEPLRRQQKILKDIMSKQSEYMKMIQEASSISGLAKALDINRTSLGLTLKAAQIDVSHFMPAKNRPSMAVDVLTVSDKRRNSTVKKFILDNDLIPYECRKCKNDGSWQGEALVLQLEHINGNAYDNTLENLEFLCPNCHSQTGTFTGRNVKRKEGD